MFKRLVRLISILGIIFLIIGVWLTIWNNIRSENLDLREKEITKLEEEYNSIIFGYRAMKLQLKNYKEKLEIKENELIVEKLSRLYSEDLIVTMADYIVFMQQLCDVNGLIYPALVVEE